jgi:hypothetical protein
MSVHPHREIFDDVPATIDPGARYLFHMHGWVVEEYGPAGAVRTGYWWRWTVEAFADRGFVVISEARPAHTDVQAYALTVARAGHLLPPCHGHARDVSLKGSELELASRLRRRPGPAFARGDRTALARLAQHG